MITEYCRIVWTSRCEQRPARSPDLTPIDYCIWGWMKDMVYEVKVGTREELIVRIMNSAAIIKNNPDKLRNAMCAVYTRATKCMEVEGGIFENLIANWDKERNVQCVSMLIKPILFVSISEVIYCGIYCYFVMNCYTLNTYNNVTISKINFFYLHFLFQIT